MDWIHPPEANRLVKSSRRRPTPELSSTGSGQIDLHPPLRTSSLPRRRPPIQTGIIRIGWVDLPNITESTSVYPVQLLSTSSKLRSNTATLIGIPIRGDDLNGQDGGACQESGGRFLQIGADSWGGGKDMHVYIHPWRTWQSVSHDSHVVDGFVASRAFRRRLRKTCVLSLRVPFAKSSHC